MSSKIIAAVVVAGGVLATTPFYLSGFFAHKALSEQMHNQLTQTGIDTSAVSILNEASELGLYKSYYAFDVVLNMEHPQLAGFKSDDTPSTLAVRFENTFKHGFLSIEGSTTYSGTLVDTLEQAVKDANFTKTNVEQPLFSFNTQADFSLSGHYQLKAQSNSQAFTMDFVNDAGEQTKVEATPMVMTSVITPETVEGSYAMESMSFHQAGATFTANQIDMTGNGSLWFSQAMDMMLWKEQSGDFLIDNITLSSGGNTVTVADKVKMTSTVTTDEQQRGHMNIRYQVKKMGIPDIPMSEVENFDLEVEGDAGVKAILAYYEQVQSLQSNPEDPQQALALFGRLLSEDINVSIKGFKSQTFAGLVDISSIVNFKAIDPAEFQQNPMLAMANLSYQASGQIPQDLLAMSGQLPPELIDNLVQQQMLEVKDGQVHFKLDGSAGSVNLNGKPLM